MGAARRVEPLGDAGDGGRRPTLLQPIGALGAVGQLAPGRAVQVQLAPDVVRPDAFLHRRRVVGDGALQRGGQVEDQRHGQHDHRRSAGDPDDALATAKCRDTLGNLATGQREHQQRQRGADRERRGQHEDRQAERCGAAGDHDGGQHRSRARDV
jgi:hypothetical protein